MAKITEGRLNEEIHQLSLKMYALQVIHSIDKMASFFQSSSSSLFPPIKGAWKNTPVDETNRQFISLEQSFLNQLKKHPEFFEGHAEYNLLEKMRLSTEILLSCVPDKISLQITDEASIFYTVFKNDLHIYFQHFLIDEFDQTDECMVSVYKGEKKILDYGGSLADTIEELSKLAPELNALPAIA
jgi:hypothetical protein